MDYLDDLKNRLPDGYESFLKKLSEYKEKGHRKKFNEKELIRNVIHIVHSNDIQKIVIGRARKSRKSNLTFIEEKLQQVDNTCKLMKRIQLGLPLGGEICLKEIDNEKYRNNLEFVRSTYLNALYKYKFRLKFEKKLLFDGQKKIGRNKAVYRTVENLKILGFSQSEAIQELSKLCNLILNDVHFDPETLLKFYRKHEKSRSKSKDFPT